MNEALLLPSWIVPVRPAGVILTDHALAIRDGLIAAVLPRAQAEREYSQWPRIELPGHVLMPGLVNLHAHSGMSLMRGLADDQPLMTWLNEHIWPAEGKVVSREFVHDGTLLACADMLKSGVTCFNDMYFFPDAAARAALAMRMRAVVSMTALEFPTPYAATADEYLDKGLAAHAELRDEPLLGFTFGPHAPYTVSDRTFERIVILANELDLPIHIHVHETAAEVAEGVKLHGKRPLERLRDLGVVAPNLLAVHAVHLTPAEIDLLAENGCHIAHCPASNLKLASGISPVAAMVKAGVNVGIGTDGAASNNRLDMLAEMRLAALLAKGASGDAGAVPAAEALSMATFNAAKALGMDDRIGSLEPGKRADIAALDFARVETTPCFDVISHLVYAASSENVTHVWVDGELLLKDRVLTRIDERELIAKAHAWKARIQP
ncbi:MAG: TRZ/ATZ family hydrolase [Burkholderiales bacterium]|nr:TRZ/ATZ family hydrolase [Burkholderiales bacterium]